MNSFQHQRQRGLDPSVIFENAEGFLRTEYFAGANLQSEAASLAEFLRLSKVHLALAQRVFAPFPFGDVFTGNENQVALAPADGFRILPHPEGAAVLADFA